MVAIIIAFPSLVTSHVTAASTVKGTGAEELQRQLQGIEPAAPGSRQEAKPESDDATSEIERALKGGK
jgi:hypothetical protein